MPYVMQHVLRNASNESLCICHSCISWDAIPVFSCKLPAIACRLWNWLADPVSVYDYVPLQGLVFGLVGMAAGTVGTGTSNGLLMLRKRLDPSFKSQNAAPKVLLNAGTWAAHMGVSSNVRYQLINGLDMVRRRLR